MCPSNRTNCQSGCDGGLLLEGLFNLSSILIHASMTMRSGSGERQLQAACTQLPAVLLRTCNAARCIVCVADDQFMHAADCGNPPPFPHSRWDNRYSAYRPSLRRALTFYLTCVEDIQLHPIRIVLRHIKSVGLQPFFWQKI